MAIASYKWRSGVTSGDHELQVAIAGYKWRSGVISGDRGLQVAIESYKLPARVLSRNREIKNLYCYLLTWIESKSNRKLLSGNEKYRDVPYGPP